MRETLTTQQFLEAITPLERGIYDLHRELGTFRHAADVLEVGSGWGIFAGSAMRLGDRVSLTTIDKIKDLPSFDRFTAGFEFRIQRKVGSSRETLPTLPDRSFDVVFVDGDHGYEGCAFDLEQALRLVRDGGWIIVDDVWHAHNFGRGPKDDYGVTRALAEFCRANGLAAEVFPAAHGIARVTVNR